MWKLVIIPVLENEEASNYKTLQLTNYMYSNKKEAIGRGQRFAQLVYSEQQGAVRAFLLALRVLCSLTLAKYHCGVGKRNY